jgi:transposase
LVFSQDHGSVESKKRIDKVVEVKFKEKPEKQPDELAGCYVIETDHHVLTAAATYEIYTSLTKVEDSFRSLKTDLGIRPVYHQLEKRTKGHLFISVLAYYLLSAIEATLERNGNHSRFSSIKETLSTHQRATVRVTTEDDVVYSIRSSGTPEPKHKEIYQTLGVKDPLRKIKRPAVHL